MLEGAEYGSYSSIHIIKRPSTYAKGAGTNDKTGQWVFYVQIHAQRGLPNEIGGQHKLIAFLKSMLI